MKILVCGRPRQGKTHLTTLLAQMGIVHFNADLIRKEINKDLGFSMADREEQARRMGLLCDLVTRAGHMTVADFVCPTKRTREIFNADFTIWVETGQKSPYEDTELLYEPLQEGEYNIKVSDYNYSIRDIYFKICATQYNKHGMAAG